MEFEWAMFYTSNTATAHICVIKVCSASNGGNP